MDERPVRERPDDHDALPADVPTEGVRIIGAVDATERGRSRSRRSTGTPRYGDRPASPPSGERPALRFPLREDGADRPQPRASAITTRATPRWTDPARSRDHGGHDLIDHHDDVGSSFVHDDETRIGALDDRDGPGSGSLFAAAGPGEAAGGGEEHGERTAVTAAVGASSRKGGATSSGKPRRKLALSRRPPAGGQGGAGSHASGQQGADRDLPVAIAVGVGLAIIAIVAMTLGPAYGVAFVTVIVTLCAAELFGALQKAGFQPATLLGLVASAGIVLSAYWRGEAALPLVLVLTVLFTFLWYLIGVSRNEPTSNAGLTILVVTYVGLFGSFAALMLRLPDGTGILLGTVLAVVANDVGALFAGRRFGRTPIAAAISPRKTIEGAIGGALASIVVSFVVLDLIGLHPWEAKGGSALALGALVAVIAPIGDLVESLVKRDLDVKDMGSLLPGHGGLIDRFDALLLVLPASYYLCRLLEIA